MQQDNGNQLSLLDLLLAATAGGVALAVYMSTLAPTVYGEDAGELIAAAYTLGIPHPTGYPLWCLLAHVFTASISAGDVAWRVNLASAAFGAAAVSVTLLLMRVVGIRRWAAGAGALALAFSLEFWEQSVIAEVYTLNALLTALCLLALAWWGQTKRLWSLCAASLCFGLGAANHQIIVLMAPVFAGYVVIAGGTSREALKRYALALAFGLLGLVPYAYLPIRAMAHPPMNWGDPESLRSFWDVITRAQFRFIITGNPRSWEKVGEQFAVFGRIYLAQFTPVIGCLGIAGVAALALRKRPGWAMLLAQFAALAIGCTVIPNFALEHKDIWLNTTYWIPCYLIAAVFIAAALEAVAGLAKTRVWQAAAAAILTAGACGAPLAAHYAANDKSEFYLARDHAMNILHTMEPDAVYFADGDHMIFPVAYLQIVEGMREDVLLTNLYGYPTEETLQPLPEDLRNRLARIPTEDDEQLVFEWYLNHVDRPVYTAIKRRASGWKAQNAGILYRMVRTGAPEPRWDDWEHYTWRGIDSGRFPGDWTAEQIHFDYYFALGRAACESGDVTRAQWAYTSAARWAHTSKDLLNNLACAAAECRLDEEAFAWFEESLALDPRYSIVRLNLVRLCVKRGLHERALHQLDEALALNPTDIRVQEMKTRVQQFLTLFPQPG